MDSAPESDEIPQRWIRREDVVVDLGRRALETDDLDRLISDAARAVAETLEVDYAAVFELSPNGDDVFLRRGIGWRDGLVGAATVTTAADSTVGGALLSEEPIIVDDLRTEQRFSGSELLTEHDVVSGISVALGSADEPWGVLGAYAKNRREFTELDASFVQRVANVLSLALKNERTTNELEEMHSRISDGFYVLDTDWTFVYLNGPAEELIDFTGEELIGTHVWEEFEWAANSEMREEYERAMETQEPTSFELYYPGPFDAWYEINAYPSRTGLSVYFRDITERKERDRFRAIFEKSFDAIAVADDGGRYVDVNESAAELFGLAEDELLGRTIAEFAPDGFDFERSWQEFQAAESERGTFPLIRADGTERLVEYAATTDIVPGQHLAVIRDITEREGHKRELQRNKEQIEVLFELLPVGVMVAADDGELLRANDTAKEIWGGEVFAAEGVSDYDQYAGWWETTGEPVEPEEWTMSRVLAGEAVTEGDLFEIETFDGERRSIMVHGKPIRNEDGEVRYGVVTQTDVTERKEYQRKLEESNERLEQFAYAASHDLQEPLRMVTSYLGLIERRFRDDMDEDGREFLEFAVDGAERMHEMIDGLLEYSRVETEGDPFEPVDLDAVLENAMVDLQLPIEEADAEITAEPLPRVHGDSRQLRQVFQNLLSNALEYSGDEPPSVHVSAERRKSTWAVSITDDGIGIDRDDLDRIFQMFQRLHSHDEHAGTGIGLALCNRIIERHGGEIWVDSEPGEGTTFSFTLPTVDDDR